MKTQFIIKISLFISAFVMIWAVSGCMGAPQNLPENAVVCEEPRHTICTMDYRPVCGYFADGTVKIFSNGCTACSNKNVVGFTHGPCSK
ncbi:hypothetical protein [uncultured Desulfobacter sp.]|uniref:hypothetical protein n=1 Tax=uncultured Desulfobacter sp. TaxID=240139 RepID=UPI0029F56B54|nr:hypothetical protein [uncultured Desulfobacter sp.]